MEGNVTYSSGVAVGLIDIQTVDEPKSVCESRGVVLHVVVAGVGEGRAVGAGVPSTSGPVAAEVCVEDLVFSLSVVGVVDGGWCGRGRAEFF